MIYNDPPKDWKDLQIKVARLFNDSGFQATTDKKVETARGPVNIDVYVRDNWYQPGAIILCECKYWARALPKTVVHAFRTVVQDSGANAGYIITSKGYQSGARIAATHSNIVLITWESLEDLMKERWLKHRHGILKRLSNDLFITFDPLFERIDPEQLSTEHKEAWYDLIREYGYPSLMHTFMYVLRSKLGENVHEWDALPKLPIRMWRLVVDDVDLYRRDTPIEFESYSEIFMFFEQEIPKAIDACKEIEKYCRMG